MRKDLFVQPKIIVIKNDLDLLRIAITPPLNALSGKQTKFIQLKDAGDIRVTRVVVEGFDELFGCGGSTYISGEVFLEIERVDGVSRIPIAQYDHPFKRDGRINTGAIAAERNNIIEAWSTAYLSAIATPSTAVSKSMSEHLGNMFRLDTGWSKLKITLIALLSIYIVLAIYSKVLDIGAKQQKNKSPVVADLMADHEDIMENVYAELGVDRSKLTNDLSCFAE